MNKQLVRLGLLACVALGAILLFVRVSFAEGGTGPADALAITDASVAAPPNSQTWYKFHEAGNAQRVKIALDANTVPGVTFSVYTPDSIARWIAQYGLHPVGVSSSSPGSDQAWTGNFEFEGDYYAVVENANPYYVAYRLSVTGDGVKSVTPPTPSPTPLPNPFATPVPVGALNDGGKIVFQQAAGSGIYTVNADGTNLKRVTYGIDPAFSPDGNKIAFAREGARSGLFVSNADGTNERLVYGANQVRSPTWVDNGRIVFSTATGDKTSAPICFAGICFGGGTFTKWSLKEHNLADASTNDVITPPTGGTVPSYNRVLKNIAFMNPEKGLMLTTLDDKVVPQLINDDLTINTPVMSPDGSRLTYIVSQPPAWQTVVSVWDGTNPTLLTKNDSLSSQHPDSVSPTFSPDGQEILFLSNRNGKWEFFAMNADGSNLRQVLKKVTDSLSLNYNYAAERMASWVESE